MKKTGLAIVALATAVFAAGCAGTGVGSGGACGACKTAPAPSCKGVSSCKGRGNGCDSK